MKMNTGIEQIKVSFLILSPAGIMWLLMSWTLVNLFFNHWEHEVSVFANSLNQAKLLPAYQEHKNLIAGYARVIHVK